ncbi:ABC transporter permease [Streptacidiphilus rugosus]|uniref:ABC transporter permease n=1 Tax=Streptacidiphilus rugosus TaxID=405783 RepID=UPI0005612671|nr:ABC transporter permease [Streptacidiphilus rugosus]
MLRYLIRRLLSGVLVLWLISLFTFGIFFVAPNNVARQICGRLCSAQQVQLVSQQLGLDQPLQVQYWHFLDRLVHGNLGYSYYNSEPVAKLLSNALPPTLSLALGASVLWLIGGVSLGVLSALRPRTLLDRGGTIFALIGVSMPSFLIGILLLNVLFFRLTVAGLAWFPPSGYVGITDDPLEWAHHLLLPWFALAFITAATYVRLTRSQMLEVLGEDYIRTARSKGLPKRRVTVRHALRAALTPAVTQFGIDLAGLLGGAIVTERIFGLPGLGQLAVISVTREDQPVVIATVLLAAVFIVVANIVVDLLYAVLDPRVRLS